MAAHLNQYIKDMEAARARERAMDRARINLLEREVQRRTEVEKGLRAQLRECHVLIEELTISKDSLSHELAMARVGSLTMTDVNEDVSATPTSILAPQVRPQQDLAPP